MLKYNSVDQQQKELKTQSKEQQTKIQIRKMQTKAQK